MPTKPTIMKRASRWASTLAPSLWSLISLKKPGKAAGSAVQPKPSTSTNSAATATRPSARGQRLPSSAAPAVSRQTSSASAAAARDPDAELLDGVPAVLAARDRERTRCASIVNGPAGHANPALAQKLAFSTRLTVDEALQVLATTPAPPDRAALSAARAARNPRVGTGTIDGDLNRPRQQVLAAAWDRAFAAVNSAAPADRQHQQVPAPRT